MQLLLHSGDIVRENALRIFHTNGHGMEIYAHYSPLIKVFKAF